MRNGINKQFGAAKIVTKTRDEAFGIATVEANCEAVKNVRYIFNKLLVIDLVSSESICGETRSRAATDEGEDN